MVAIAMAIVLRAAPSLAMCGGMFPLDERPRPPDPRDLVAQRILNKASKVALFREGELTVLTMSNDVITDVDEFGLVVPVPTVIKEKDVRISDPALFAALEQLTNPKLVETWDPEPCPDRMAMAQAEATAKVASAPSPPSAGGGLRAADYGVKVEAHYDVGEYSIAVLGAQQGRGAGLVEWLNKFHYAVPQEAIPVLNSYIGQNMKFFVAKVNFRKLKGKGATFLRPIQVRYTTPRFMLPVRLGTINADGPQELVAWAVSAKGRIEATNYRTARMPTGHDLPLYVKDQLEKVYAAIFDQETRKADMRVIFTEFVQRGGLDGTTAEKLGVSWGRAPESDVSYLTLSRLHFRYDRDHFPEDLVLQETADIEPYAVSYAVKHPATRVDCPEGATYLASLGPRRENEAGNLASLTGWDAKEIREKMGLGPMVPPRPSTPTPQAPAPPPKKSFWQRLFSDE